MRIAIVSDIHGNLGAFEAVLADLSTCTPDIVLHGGDLADGGRGGPEIIDRIRHLGWRGVFGNTDEMLFRPESLAEFGERTPAVGPLLAAIQEMAAWSRQALGAERVAWLAGLPPTLAEGDIALVHASPGNCWRAPSAEASYADLETTYAPLGKALAVYGHIHRPFIRSLEGFTVANSGSVGLPYDGDLRASYLLIDDGRAQIRRVEYDVEAEAKAVSACGLPHAAWVVKMLASGRPQMP
jgi:predicted phosphodiesterase